MCRREDVCKAKKVAKRKRKKEIEGRLIGLKRKSKELGDQHG